MPLTVRRKPPIVNMLAASLLGVASGVLVLTLPQDLAYGQGNIAQRGPATVVLNADVMVLLGTNVEGRGSIDPAIGNLPQLREPPASAFNSYHLLDKRTLALPAGHSATYTMPNGRVLKLTLAEPSAERNYHITVATSDPTRSGPGHNVALSIKENRWYLQGGQRWNGGTIVFAVRVRP